MERKKAGIEKTNGFSARTPWGWVGPGVPWGWVGAKAPWGWVGFKGTLGVSRVGVGLR